MCFVDKKDWERLGRLRPKEKVNMAIGMSDFVLSVCAEGIKAQHPDITEEELIEKLRERIEWAKRWRKSDPKFKRVVLC